MNARRKRTRTSKVRLATIHPIGGAGVVRLERVSQARRRIASGWYDRADVRDRLVEAVLEEIRRS